MAMTISKILLGQDCCHYIYPCIDGCMNAGKTNGKYFTPKKQVYCTPKKQGGVSSLAKEPQMSSMPSLLALPGTCCL